VHSLYFHFGAAVETLTVLLTTCLFSRGILRFVRLSICSPLVRSTAW
jgi:hypothetical protein